MKALLLITFVSLIRTSWGNQAGANVLACASLTPQHGPQPQAGETSYTVTVNSATYTPGQDIQVTISSKCGDQFKGFLAQARLAENDLDQLLGTFTAVTDTALQTQCTGSALTHNSATLKSSLTFTWTAPSVNSGHIIIRVTFVQSFTVFWVGVNSPVISESGLAPLAQATVDNLVTPTFATCPTAAPASGTLAPDSGCGSTKGCFQSCTDNDCEFVLTWVANGANVNFELSAKVGTTDNLWAAVGLSTDSTMGDDSVLGCIVDGGTVKLDQSYNTAAKTNEQVTTQTGTFTSGTYADGIIRCVFSIPTASSDVKIFNLNDDYTLLLGTGAYNSAGQTKLQHTTIPSSSDSQADFQSTTQNIGVSSSLPLEMPVSGTLAPDSGCGSAKGCFQSCTDNDCEFVLTWLENGANVEFELGAKVGTTDNLWAAVGLSTDSTMGDDTVFGCIVDGGTVKLDQSYNTAAKTNEQVTQTGTFTSGTYADGIIRCVFSIPTTSSNIKIFNLNDDYTLLLGTGVYNSAGLTKLQHSTIPSSSDSQADFQSTTQNIGGSSSFPLVKAHGSMMVLAWIFSASIGLVLARYFKPMWPNSKLCGEKVWFSLHRSFMMTTFFLCLTAFILIFVSTNGQYSQFPISSPVYLMAHPILGICVMILCIINPVMAMLRPHPGTSKRPIFNWAHWGVGTAAEILAVITIFFGIDLPKATTPASARWVLVAFVVHLVLVTLTLEVHQYMTSKKNKVVKEEVEIEMKNKANGDVDYPVPMPPPSGSMLKSVVLVYHMCASFGLALAVVIIIAVN